MALKGVVTKNTGNDTAKEEMDPIYYPNQVGKLDIGTQKIGENKEQQQWVNKFRNNRAAQNCMNLTYIPPQIVDGHTTVQLEDKDVQFEEEKWKCVLIVYVVYECPGYNTMTRYVTINWSSVAKTDIFLHDEGYFIMKF